MKVMISTRSWNINTSVCTGMHMACASWLIRALVTYGRRFRGNGRAELTYPAAFTVCTQRLEGSGAWIFPSADSQEWLCAHPV